MTERYIDPNSGAAAQPGGFAVSAPVQVSDESQSTEENPPVDATLDAAREVSAAPQGSQPGDPDGEDAGEDGTSETKEGGGSEAVASDGASADEGVTEEETTTPSEDDEEGSKDYSELLSEKMPVVQKYMDENPDEKEAVQAAELERETPRKGIVEH